MTLSYETGTRLDALEAAVGELQRKAFPKRFKDDKSEENPEDD